MINLVCGYRCFLNIFLRVCWMWCHIILLQFFQIRMVGSLKWKSPHSSNVYQDLINIEKFKFIDSFQPLTIVTKSPPSWMLHKLLDLNALFHYCFILPAFCRWCISHLIYFANQLIVMIFIQSIVKEERWSMSETMALNNLNQVMLVWCDSWCINIGDRG